jgi:hypothetical protein
MNNKELNWGQTLINISKGHTGQARQKHKKSASSFITTQMFVTKSSEAPIARAACNMQRSKVAKLWLLLNYIP